MFYVRLYQGIQGQMVNSDVDKLLVKPFCFLYSDTNYTINQNKFNTRRKLRNSIFINRLPQSRLTTLKRVRACESGQSVIETRCLLFSNAKRDEIVLDKHIFSDKSTENLHMFFLCYTL